MQIPKATLILVSAALLYLVWGQTREQPEPVSAERFTNLSARPAERGLVVDWAVAELPRLCREATGKAEGSPDVARCLEASEAREPACRRMAVDRFPSMVASERVFRDLSISMMDCLVKQSRVQPG